MWWTAGSLLSVFSINLWRKKESKIVLLALLLHNASSGELALLSMDTLQEGYIKVERESETSPCSSRASPRPQLCTPAESALGLWPGARWFCRRAGWWQGCISPERRHSAGAAGYCTTLGGRKTPEQAEKKEGHQKHNTVHSSVNICSKWDDSAPRSTWDHAGTCTATYTRQDKKIRVGFEVSIIPWLDIFMHGNNYCYPFTNTAPLGQ